MPCFSPHVAHSMARQLMTYIILGAMSLLSLRYDRPSVTLAASPYTSLEGSCVQSSANYNIGYTPNSIALGDVNGDGRLDIVATLHQDNSVSVALGDGFGGFQPISASYQVGFQPQVATLGDVNEDGKLDIVEVNDGSGTVGVLIGNGNGTFVTPTTYIVESSPRGLALGDLNGDGHLDIAASNYNSNTISILLGTGTGTFSTAVSYAIGTAPLRLAIGDVNNDGKPDLVAAIIPNSVGVLFGTGTGSFGSATTYPAVAAANSGSTDVSINDLNNDGKADLVVSNGGANSVGVLLGTGGGIFGPPTTYAVGSNSISIDVADLNGDQILDFVAANWYGNSVSVYYGKGNGTFLTGPTYPAAGGQANSATFADLDGNGHLAIVVANYTYSVATVIHPEITDTSPPTGSILLNQGANTTTLPMVTLGLSAQDKGCGVASVAFSTDGATYTSFEPYNSRKILALPAGDGTKTVYAVFKDNAGNVSQPVSATIMLDTQAPTVTIAPLGLYQNNQQFSIAFSGTDATSGVASYDVQVKDGTSGSWKDVVLGTKEITVPFNGEDGHTYAFRARARDVAGNVSVYTSGNSQTTIDATAPAVDWLFINGGAPNTVTSTVMLSVRATDATSGLSVMSFSNDGTTWSSWHPYAGASKWDLGSDTGNHTVYARFRDNAGNVSQSALATIVFNPIATIDYGLTINNGALYTNNITVTLTIKAQAGVDQMKISNDGGFAGVDWEPYIAQKTWQITKYGASVLPRIVYVRFKGADGQSTATYQDDIILDMSPPQGQVRITNANQLQSLAHTGSTSKVADDHQVLLEFSATDDLSGVSSMRVSNKADFAGTDWQLYSTSLSWDLDSSLTVYVQFRDNAGNISNVSTSSLRAQWQTYVPIATR